MSLTSKKLLALAAGVALLLPARQAHAEDPLPLFTDQAILPIVIEGPIRQLVDERPVDSYLEGKLRYVDDGGDTVELDLKFQARGNLRRRPSVCNFPPVRLNFRKKQVAGTVFDGQDKLKLVAHCQQRKRNYEQLVLKEYLAYRFLNIVTDKSLYVRRLQIEYRDTETGDTFSRVGFVIEDDDDAAKRLGLKSPKAPNIEHADLDPAQENIANVFHYLIGNTDYSLIQGMDAADCCHNTILMSANNSPPYTPVPYDFDMSGLVDAPYAQPDPTLKLRSVRQRLYRGQCANNEHLPSTLSLFREQQAEFYELTASLDGLSNLSRNATRGYLDEFFRRISDPGRIARYLEGRCAGSD